jgi:CSLREA domain-containing protein
MTPLRGLLLLGLVTTAVVFPGHASAATISVTGTADVLGADGTCSLREAVQAANTDAAVNECGAGSGADTVVLPAGTFALTRAGAAEDANVTGDLDVLADLTLQGAGAGRTTLDGNGLDRVLDVAAGKSLAIERLTVTGGLTEDGAGGLTPTPGGAGGGIRAAGPLTVTDCEITGNRTGRGGNGASATGTNGAAAGNGAPGQAVGGGVGGAGGGIAATAALTVTRSTISGNLTGDGGDAGAGTGGLGGGATGSTAGGAGGAGFGGFGAASGSGGGISADAAATITNSTITDNATGEGGRAGDGTGSAGGAGGPTSGAGGAGGAAFGGFGGGGGSGGGVSATASLTVTGSTFDGNRTGSGGVGGDATGGAGGAAGGGNAAGGSGGAGFGGFGGAGGLGGAIYASKVAAISGSTLVGNISGQGGLGGAGAGGTGGSGAGSADGGAGAAGFGGFGGSGAAGGAISGLTATSDITVTNSTLTRNATRGGGAGDAGVGGPGGSGGGGTGDGGPGGAGFGGFGGPGGLGGGVAMANGKVALSHLTITSNTLGSGAGGGNATAGGGGGNGGGGGSTGAAGSAFIGSGGAAGAGGGVANISASSVKVGNSIVSRNDDASCSGTITDTGHNVVFGDATCPGTVADPQLGALQDNGGPTRTRALHAGSPALDVVPSSGSDCAATDQRGVTRPVGGACDAGAYELAAPAATTGDATAVTARTATVAATVNPNGRLTTFYFQYGADIGYGSKSAESDAGAGVAGSAQTGTLTGLTPNTTYHFRVVAVSADGTSVGGDRTFTTAALAPPAVTTEAATAIGASTATLAGTVNPNGRATTFHFEYGTTTAYGTSTPETPAGAGTAAAAVTTAVTGLAKGTFHFRLVATNADGTTAGVDKTFTTASDTTKPVLSKVSFTKGATLKFTLSEAASVLVTVERKGTGRRSGSRCVKQTKANRTKKKCVLFTRVARVTLAGKAGANTKAYKGKVGSKKLAAGSYRVTLLATDPAGNKSKSTRANFKVARR